ncbi:MAG: TonB-dependent receptor [Comamonas sp.]|uniref:TonB-dependent receptor n=1 Tax=Comamonas sp. TaxID=34028 RepID=UPI00281F1E7A|nr:TonB-dependent receptor [Comamonas sp.]MDR0215357.1 TonB-dependent receptor [Comamonas sp.]
MAQQTLPEVTVQETRQADSKLETDRPATSASHVDVRTLDLPASVSGVTAEQMQERADYGVVEAVTRTVGLSSSSEPGNGGLSFSSRGFNGSNSVGVAEDGLVLGVAAETIAYPNSSWGYERLDVMRGPASLMYGSGAMGATINAVRKQPSREASTELLLSAGSRGTVRAGVGSTGAISDTLSYRIDAYGERTDGERHLDNARNGKLMSALRWTPRSDLTFDLTADISNQAPSRYYGTPTADGRVVSALRDKSYNVNDADIHYQDQRLKAKAEWRVNEALTLRNEFYHLSSKRHWKNIEGYKYVADTGMIERSEYLEIGHNVQQNGNRMAMDWKSGAHTVAMGWDFSHANFRSTGSYYSPDEDIPELISAYQPVNGNWSSPTPYLPSYQSTVKQNALFIEDAWKINDQWLLMGGIRRDWYDFSRLTYSTNAALDKSLNGTSWRLGLTRKLTEQSSVYAQVSTGHDPVTSLLSLSKSRSNYSLSKGRQEEIGFKQQLAEGRGEWTAALFHIAKKDIITSDPDHPSQTIQGGKQSSRGLELTGAFNVSKAFRLEANAAYTDAKFDELMRGTVNRAGNRPGNVPRVTANVWGHYRINDWRASLGLRYVGSRFTDETNTERMPGYTVMDAVVSWNVNPKTTLSLIGRNLTNRMYASSAYNTQWFLGPRRSVELMAQMHF